MPYRDSEKRRAYHREYKRRSRSTVAQTPGTTPIPPPLRIQTARDVLDLVAAEVAAVKADTSAGTLEKARTVGFLASIALRAVEAADITTRLEAVEAALTRRPSA